MWPLHSLLENFYTNSRKDNLIHWGFVPLMHELSRSVRQAWLPERYVPMRALSASLFKLHYNFVNNLQPVATRQLGKRYRLFKHLIILHWTL